MFKISVQTKRKIRNRLIFLVVIAAAVAAYVIYVNSFTIYDFSHLTVTQDFGPARPFEPLGGTTVPGMVQVAETQYLALYISPQTTNIAVVDNRNGHIWYSSPLGTNTDSIANPWERDTMRSHVGFRFFDEGRRRQTRWLYPDSIAQGEEGQFEMFSIPNGVRIEYMIGNLDIGIDAIPFFIEAEYFEYRIRPAIEDNNDRRMIYGSWHPSATLDGFMQLTEGIRNSVINSNNMLEFFDRIGWTYEDTLAANALAGVELDISFDFFDLVLEFVLEDDRLIANLPISEFTTESPAEAFDLDFMKFFGAGGREADGFMLVPSGAGGIISFNNGGHRDDPFRSAVYGLDPMLNHIRPQVVQPVRLPVLGIQNDGAAILAHVYNGQALATVNADVAGRTNSYNHAWFSFTLRTSQALNMDGIPGAAGDLTVVQEESYMGDITVVYHFLAGDNPGIGEMAQAYQDFLVSRGALTPLDGPGDRTFYMDVVGAVGVRNHFLGTPYTTVEIMSTIDDANRFVDLLNAQGINNIQMQLHGWFNRGMNHDVAKNINIINNVGRANDIRDLDNRLQGSGGGLNPVVNFNTTAFGDRSPRNLSTTHEVALDITGIRGVMSGGRRDMLSHRAGIGWTDFHFLVHPGVLPFHIDEFLPAFDRRLGIDNIALGDLGAMVNESFFRRDPVNRESSRHIVVEQMGRIQDEIPNMVVFGGNDYSLAFASHLVDVPTRADMFHIIDYEVPFFPMVVHGFVEFAGASANLREHYDAVSILLESMATGAAPRYTFTAEPTRNAQFSPFERMYSTQYSNWIDIAMEHYGVFNRYHRYLRGERIVDFEILAGRRADTNSFSQVTVTEFSNGTRIYVNNTQADFNAGSVTIPARWFVVEGGSH